ncbi:glyoxalase [Saccharomonospora piscinae]|uniref:Glyoxalase n=1 Tax=Saccharomonospora piscinae TaxID=687388 RepID=A0A1V9A196_SACPI|nr:VOC family protein [Saccharomonospora piscinae]OQO90917.1 glyoxalase [Saccharomonospora piscinae]TLW93610.1 VOC family protein [Saccharomonospora piscinae]
MSTSIRLDCVVLDCPDPERLARFYGALLGWVADEPEDDGNWVTLRDPARSGATGAPIALAFQRDPDFLAPTWPSPERAQMSHLDFLVTDRDSQGRRALELGATLLRDSPGASFTVYADPAGHPFCLCDHPA